MLIHYPGWHSKWDEWIDASSARFAPLRTHTMSDAGAASSGASSGWEWADDDGQWQAFSAAVSEQLDAANAASLSSLVVAMSGNRYVMDFSALTQRNLRTGYRRRIRRGARTSSSARGSTDATRAAIRSRIARARDSSDGAMLLAQARPTCA